MADFVSKLKLDASGFVKGVKVAVGAVEDLPDKKSVTLDTNADTVTKDLKDVGAASDEAGKGLGGLVDKLKGLTEGFDGANLGEQATNMLGIGAAFAGAQAAIGAVTGALSAVAGAFGDVYEQGKAVNEELKKIALQTGATKEELAGIASAGEDAFKLGVGENVAEATKALAELRKALGDAIPADQLAQKTAEIGKVADAFGVDQAAVIAAVQSQVKQFGITADEALNNVTGALQAAPKDAGELLDTFKEFSQNAAEAGLTSEEFSGKLIKGAQAGAFQLSKVGDGIKELNTRLKAGDISANLAATSGQIGKDLQNIAKQGESGLKNAKQVGEEYSNRISEALKKGEITQAKAGELLAVAFGSAAEDLGNKLSADIFAGAVDTKAIKDNATKAGNDIKAEVANIDPFEALQRGFTAFTTDVGKFFNSFATTIIAPIFSAFDEIKTAFTDAFNVEGAGDAFAGIIETVKSVIGGLISNVIAPTKEVLKTIVSIVGTVFQTIKDAVSPIVDAFKELFAALDTGGDSAFTFADVLDTIGDGVRAVGGVLIKVLLTPLKLVFKAIEVGVKVITALVGYVKDAGKAVFEWATSFEPLNKALTAVGEFIFGLVDKIKNFAGAIGDFLGITESDEGEKQVKKTGAAYDDVAAKAKKAKEQADELAASQRAAATDVNALAKSFNDSLAAQQNSVANFLAASAQARQTGNDALSKQFIKDAKEAQRAQRELERSQDNSAFQIDPNRQRARDQANAEQAQQTKKQRELLDASLIASARVREQAILDIEQKFARLALDEQIKTARVAANTAGAGQKEAQTQLSALIKEQSRLTVEQTLQQEELRRKFFEETVTLAIDQENRRKDAVIKVAQATSEFLQRQVNFGDLSTDTIERVADLAVQQAKAQAEAEARAFVESLPDFQKQKQELIFTAALNKQSVEETRVAIERLASDFTGDLLDANSNPATRSAISQSFADLFTKGEIAASDASLQVFRDARAKRIGFLQDASIRERAVAVDALENERDDLLRNDTLTGEQRERIAREYAKRIAKAQLAGFGTIKDLALSVGDAFKNLQINLDGAGGSAEDIAKQVEEINKALRQGEITYQEATDRLAELKDATSGFLGTLSMAAEQVFGGLADSTQEFALAQVAALQKAFDEKRALDDNELASAEEKQKKLEEINKRTEDTYTAVGAAAASAFAAAIVSGEDAGKALVKTSLEVLDSLVPIFAAQIAGAMFASPASGATLGAAGLVATAALTGILKGLVAAAKASAGFKDGGYTGNGGVNDVAGVVHGKEFVVNAQAVANPLNRAVLEAMNSAGGKSVAWVRDNAPQVDTNAIIMDTSRIVATEIGSLRNEFSSLRQDVQALGVQINRNVSVQGNFVAKGGDLRAIVNIDKRKQLLRAAR